VTAGLSQHKLAAAIGRKPSTVTSYESGAIEPPLSVLCRIAEATGCSLIELLNLEPTHADLLRMLLRGNGDGSDQDAGGNSPVEGIVVGLLVRPNGDG